MTDRNWHDDRFADDVRGVRDGLDRWWARPITLLPLAVFLAAAGLVTALAVLVGGGR